MGVAAQGGADALLGRATLAGLATNDNSDEMRRQRFEARLSYGFPAFGHRFTATPEIAVGLSDTGRDYGLGWRLTTAESRPMAPCWSLPSKRGDSRARLGETRRRSTPPPSG